MRRFGLVAVALIIAVLGASPPAPAQLTREHEAQGLRAFHGTSSPIRRSFQSDAEAQAIFKHILAASGLAGMEDRIAVRASADTPYAEAFVEKTADKEERLIFYNAEFLQRIARKDNNYWSMVAILAHEVGHHIRMHTIIPGRDHEFELEADYQAGFILRRMNATLEQTQAAFQGLSETPSHPPRAQRVQAATLGWNQGGSAPAFEATAQQSGEAAEAWRLTKDTQSIPELEAFMRRYGNTYYGDLAKIRLAALKESADLEKTVTGAKKEGEVARPAPRHYFWGRDRCLHRTLNGLAMGLPDLDHVCLKPGEIPG